MADANVPGQMTGELLIESDRVEGATVYDPRGTNIGSIKRLMIEKLTGKVAYAVFRSRHQRTAPSWEWERPGASF